MYDLAREMCSWSFDRGAVGALRPTMISVEWKHIRGLVLQARRLPEKPWAVCVSSSWWGKVQAPFIINFFPSWVFFHQWEEMLIRQEAHDPCIQAGNEGETLSSTFWSIYPDGKWGWAVSSVFSAGRKPSGHWIPDRRSGLSDLCRPSKHQRMGLRPASRQSVTRGSLEELCFATQCFLIIIPSRIPFLHWL